MDQLKEDLIKDYKAFMLKEPLEDFISRFCISGMGDIYQRMNGDLDWVIAMQDILRERFKKEINKINYGGLNGKAVESD